ncbi:MAG: sigma-70 family RNA polymerase sigma factor [Verrucomicrobiota bacterium]
MVNRDTFIDAYMEIQPPLRAYLIASIGNPHEAEDLAQVVWQVLWKKLDEYDPSRPFKAWVFGIARMEVLKWRQRKARAREIFSDETLSKLADTANEEAEELAIRHQFLIDCVRQLDERPREALELKYVRRMRSRNMAVVLKKSVTAIDMLLSRARRMLRDCLERKVAEAR